MLVGVDLGGTKIEAVLMSGQGVILKRQRIATPAGDYPATLSAIVKIILAISHDVSEPFTVGIGTPGSVSRIDGRMKNCNSTCLNGQTLQSDLEQRLGYSIRIANDANCFALSEAMDGAAQEKRVVFGVILGTGVGGSVVIDKQALLGPSAIGSEWGHNLLPGLGSEFSNEHRPCYCGRENCIETYLSGPGLALTYKKNSGRLLPAIDILALLEQGDNHAFAALEQYQQQLAYALSQVINILDPDCIVLGGGLSNIASLYEGVPRLWPEYVFSDRVEVALLPAQYGDSSGVRGAAWLWQERYS